MKNSVEVKYQGQVATLDDINSVFLEYQYTKAKMDNFRTQLLEQMQKYDIEKLELEDFTIIRRKPYTGKRLNQDAAKGVIKAAGYNLDDFMNETEYGESVQIKEKR